MRRRLLLASLSLALPLAGLAVPAEADSIHDIGITAFSDLLVDEAHGHVFVTQGSGSSVVVTDLAGTPVTTLNGLSDASGMTLNDDGSTLYIALAGDQAIAAVDTATLAVTTMPTGNDICPNEVAYTAGLVWFTYWCPDGGPNDVGALNPDTGTVSLGLAGHRAQELEAGPQLPGTLIVSNLSDGRVFAYDAAGGETPSLTSRGSRFVQGYDVALSTDGTEVYVSGGQVLRSSDLGLLRSFPATYTLALRGDGMLATEGESTSGTRINLFKAHSADLWSYYPLGVQSSDIRNGGIEFGNTDMYMVTFDSGTPDKDFRLRVITPRLFTAVELRTNKLIYKYGETAKLTVLLNSDSPNQLVKVYATPYGGVRRLVKAAAVDENGVLQVGYSMKRRTAFSVVYDGDETYAPASDVQTVRARAGFIPEMYGHQRRAGKYYLFDLAHDARMKAKVLPNHAGECVRFRLMYYNVPDTAWYPAGMSGCIPLNVRSVGRTWVNARKDLVGYRFRLRAEWDHTTENFDGVSAWRYFKFVK